MATATSKKTSRAAAKAAAQEPSAAAPAVVEAQPDIAAPVQEEVRPVSVPPSRPADKRILSIAATIMIEYPEDGATEAELAAHTGIDADELGQLLSAMAFAKAAVKNTSTDADGAEVVRWSLGTVKPSQVDPTNLPPCPLCGLVPPPVRSAKRSTANGGARGGVNHDGKPTLARGELSRMVKAFIEEHAGEQLSATVIAKELSDTHDRKIGASSVAYAIDAMLNNGELTADPRQ